MFRAHRWRSQSPKIGERNVPDPTPIASFWLSGGVEFDDVARRGIARIPRNKIGRMHIRVRVLGIRHHGDETLLDLAHLGKAGEVEDIRARATLQTIRPQAKCRLDLAMI